MQTIGTTYPPELNWSRLLLIAVVGRALIQYQVSKLSADRSYLVGLAAEGKSRGILNVEDLEVVDATICSVESHSERNRGHRFIGMCV